MVAVWKKVVRAFWQHRAMYLGLAVGYGCACLGWVDKETVNAVAFGCYTAMVMQKH